MLLGYIHLDYYKNIQTDTYNLQEIGLAKAVAELGHKMLIVFWVSKDDRRCNTTIEISFGITIKFLPYILRIVHHVLPDFSQLNDLGLDAVLLHSDNLFFVPEAIGYCQKRGWIHFCYIGTIHSSTKNVVIRRIVDLLTRRNFPSLRATKVFCKNLAVMQELRSRRITNVEWAPVGLDLSIIPPIEQSKKELRKEFSIPKNKTVVLLVCALRHDKRPMDIFALSKLLGNNFLIIHIGIERDQADEYKKELAKGYNNIMYLGTIPNRKVHLYYKIADWVINFNPDEIFGMTLLEAMYHDITIVARHAPGPDCICDKDSGFLCDSIEEMSEIIKKGTKKTGVRIRVIEMFTWLFSAKRFVSYSIYGV